jgi:hypothetical protein
MKNMNHEINLMRYDTLRYHTTFVIGPPHIRPPAYVIHEERRHAPYPNTFLMRSKTCCFHPACVMPTQS